MSNLRTLNLPLNGSSVTLEFEFWGTGLLNLAIRHDARIIRGWLGEKERRLLTGFLTSGPPDEERWIIISPGGSTLTECEGPSEATAWNLFLFSQETVPEDDRGSDREYFLSHAVHRGYKAEKLL